MDLPVSSQPSLNNSSAVLVLGGGIAGIQAALDLADAGCQVVLVERSPSIGGRMAQLDKTFPTLDCSSCILTPKMADVLRHPLIHLLTCSEIASVEREAGNFQVKLTQHPRYVDVKSCTGCGACAEVCPVERPNEFNAGLDRVKAIYRSFPQAVPSAFVIDKRPSPCKSACPAHIPVQGYIALIAQGKFNQAYERVLQAGVPLVGTLGRVCYHPCETVCKRGEWDAPVAICALKRFAYDAAEPKIPPEPLPRKWPERVAVVGAGPAGLTAAFGLVRLGYSVTILDALPAPGGMLAAGIPHFRLPRQVLEQEIQQITALGVQLCLNTPVGRAGGPSLEQLRQEYQAVFLAIGAQKSSRMNIPGEDLPEVRQGLEFLRELNLGKPVQAGQRTVVIGGGNTAIDAARCAVRLGAEVQILYRRSRSEMPASAEEVAAAEAEGVKIDFLTAPVQALAQDGHLKAIQCIRMQLGEPDASGRRRPVPIPGSEFTIEADMLISAIGQTVDSGGLGLETSPSGVIKADPLTLETSLPGVFAGGDAVTGPASVVEAVGAGLRAVESIHRYLRGLDLREGRMVSWPAPESIRVTPTWPVRPAERIPMPERPTLERLHDFAEVALGLDAEQAMREAQRCLECAVCSECLQCEAACQRGAIRHDDQPQTIQVQVGAILVATGFDVFDPHRKPELGYGQYPQVITSLEFERLASASGPTGGKISLNGRPPRDIVFIQCVGSRDQSLNLPNCSRVCCMAVAKQAHLAHERLPEARITVFYMDVRAFGKGFEEFYDRVRQEGVRYRRGSPSEILRRGEKLLVRAEDTLLGEAVEVEADLVVLAVGIQPRPDTPELAQKLQLSLTEDGYFHELHPKLQPVESNVPGIFLAGCCQGPKDIPDTVAHAKAAAAAALVFLNNQRKPLC